MSVTCHGQTPAPRKAAWTHRDADSVFGSFFEGAGLKELGETQSMGSTCRDTEQSGLQTQKPSPLRKRMIRLVEKTFRNILKQDQVQTNTHDIMWQEGMALDH